MITMQNDMSLFSPHNNLQKMLYDKAIVQQLARQLVAGQVEAHIEMGCDGGNEYKTHQEAAYMIEGAKVTVEDYIEDLLTDFRGMLYDAVRSVEIDVKATSFTADGFKDAEVEVK